MNDYKILTPDSTQSFIQNQDKPKSELLQELASLRQRVDELIKKEDQCQRLSKDLARLAAVVDDSNDAVTVQNFDGTILEWNGGAERMYGYSQEEALDGNIVLIIPKEKRKENREVVSKLAHGKNVEPRETQRITKDSKILDIWLTETVLNDELGKPYAIATTERDITEQKKREQNQKSLIEQLEGALQNLQETNNFKNNMLGMVAHDLRNPLFIINGYAELLLAKNNNPNLNQKQIKTLEKIYQAGKKMGRLIDDLLDLSKIEQEKIQLNKTENEFKALILEQLELNKILAEKKNIKIRSDLQKNMILQFDRHRIGQVIDNLISNAIKFSPHHSTLFVSSHKNGDGVTFSVRDEGPGISIDEQKLIFQPFQTLSARPTGGETSTGLGLSIAKNFVSLHGGEIGVSSKPGKGSTFYFTLPSNNAH